MSNNCPPTIPNIRPFLSGLGRIEIWGPIYSFKHLLVLRCLKGYANANSHGQYTNILQNVYSTVSKYMILTLLSPFTFIGSSDKQPNQRKANFYTPSPQVWQPLFFSKFKRRVSPISPVTNSQSHRLTNRHAHDGHVHRRLAEWGRNRCGLRGTKLRKVCRWRAVQPFEWKCGLCGFRVYYVRDSDLLHFLHFRDFAAR